MFAIVMYVEIILREWANEVRLRKDEVLPFVPTVGLRIGTPKGEPKGEGVSFLVEELEYLVGDGRFFATSRASYSADEPKQREDQDHLARSLIRRYVAAGWRAIDLRDASEDEGLAQLRSEGFSVIALGDRQVYVSPLELFTLDCQGRGYKVVD